MWSSIAKILPFNINKLGLGAVLEVNEVCGQWDPVIEKVLGEAYTKKAKPTAFKNKTLVVDCLNSIWASEFQLKQAKIIEAINKHFKKEAVERIRFIS